MDGMIDLNQKGLDAGGLANLAAEDAQLLDALLQGIGPARTPTLVRENSAAALRLLAREHPGVLLRHWDYFMELLRNGNGFSMLPAVHIIADLVRLDDAGRFERSFGLFYDLLDDRSVMIASHVAGVSGKIARHKSALCSRIVAALLRIDATHHESGRKELVKSYIIESLVECIDLLDDAEDRNTVIAFVQAQLVSESPRTKKAARAALKGWARLK